MTRPVICRYVLVSCKLLSVVSCRQGLPQVVETSVTATDNSPSQDYTHPDDQATLLHVTPGFKPFTVLPILFVLLLLLFLSFTLVGDACHSFFEHRRYFINQVCHISTPAQDRTVCKP